MTKALSLIALVLLFSCSQEVTENAEPQNGDLIVTWSVEKAEPGLDSATFTLINTGETVLGKDWKIYFNQMSSRSTDKFRNKSASISQVNGYFYVLEPSSGFKSLQPGDTAILRYEIPGPVGRISYIPEGVYYVIGGNEPVAVPESNVKYYATGLPLSLQGISPEERFRKNQDVSLVDIEDLLPVLPAPSTFAYDRDTLYLEEVSINYRSGLENEVDHLGMRLSKFFTGSIQLTPNNINADIHLTIDSAMKGGGAYHLTINPNGVRIKAADDEGIFYGIQTLTSQLILEDKKTDKIGLRHILIYDEPRFPYRGLHVDMARNFKSKDDLLKVIDIMSYYKLNKLNLQVADDEGWRLEIPSIPELTEVGGRRGHTTDERDMIHPAYGSGPDPDNPERGGSGWYSREDFIEILRYANQRHVEVIPKLDFPGHARAAIKAMESRYYRLKEDGVDEDFASNYLLSDLNDESDYRSVQGYDDNVICVCRESVYTFLETVVDEVIAMYEEAGIPLNIVHLGGDEVPDGVWMGSEYCRDTVKKNDWDDPKNDLTSYFVERANEILARRNIITAGWEEFASVESKDGLEPNPEFVGKKILPYVWHKEYVNPLANTGYQLIMCNSNSVYFDLAYEQDVMEPGLAWAGYVGPRQPFDLNPYNLNVDDKLERPENILGLQAQLWGETIWNGERLQYYLIPKIHAFAQRAWSEEPGWAKNPNEKAYKEDWNRFVNTIGQKEFNRLNILVEGVTVRLPRPGAEVRDGVLYANSELPGLEIRYTTDGTEPVYNSTIYSEPVEVNGLVKLKTFFKGNKSLTTTVNQ